MLKIIISLFMMLLICSNPAIAFVKSKFMTLSDIHLKLKGKNTMMLSESSLEIAEACVKKANEIKDLDFVLIPGDLTNDGEPWNLDTIKMVLDNLKIPYYVVLGNHDLSPIQMNPDKPPFSSVSKSTFVWAFQGHGFNSPKSWWSTDPVEGLHIIGLDSTVPGSWGAHISDAQLRWLEKDLSENNTKINIILLHHGLVADTKYDHTDAWGKFLVDNAEEVLKILKRHQVKFVIHGHHHLSNVQTVDGITHFASPSTSSYPTRYTIFDLTPSTLTYKNEWVPIDKGLIDQAKESLVIDKWWGAPFPEENRREIMLKQYSGEESTDVAGTIDFIGN